MLRTKLRDTKRNTPGPSGPVFDAVRLLLRVAVVFLAGWLHPPPSRWSRIAADQGRQEFICLEDSDPVVPPWGSVAPC